MKKMILICSIVFISYYSNAQSFTFGPKFGIQTHQLKNLDTIKSQLKVGFNLGAFARIGISKFFIQPELYYSIQSGTYKLERNGTSVDQKVHLNAITVPLLLGGTLFDAKLAKIYLMGGPAVAFNINNDVSTNNTDAAKFPIKSKDDFKKANWSLQFGGGVDILKFTFDLRYELGLSNIYAGEKTNIDIKNSHFLINLGYKIF